jgi:hypothetical protein
MRLPNLSSSVVRRSSAPAGGGRDRVGLLMSPSGAPALACNDACNPNVGGCPVRCPCAEAADGTFTCKGVGTPPH